MMIPQERLLLAKVLISAFSIGMGAMVVRVFAGIISIIHVDSAFGQMIQVEAQKIIALTPFDFTVVVALGGAGGVVSYFKEQKATEWRHIRLFGALGHVLAAQFAASIVFLVAVEFGWSEPWGFAVCGLAGWMGNRALELLESLVVKRLGASPAEAKSVPSADLPPQ